MGNRVKISPKHITINTVNVFTKTIKLCGVDIIPMFDWMDEADGALTAQYIIDHVLPKNETYYAGRTSNTNDYGYVVCGSTKTTMTQSELEEHDHINFHPYLKIELSDGYLKTTKMDGSWESDK